MIYNIYNVIIIIIIIWKLILIDLKFGKFGINSRCVGCPLEAPHMVPLGIKHSTSTGTTVLCISRKGIFFLFINIL